MKRSHFFFAALLLVFTGAGCARPAVVEPSAPSSVVPTSEDGTIVGERSILQVETDLGFNLPADAILIGVVQNDQQYQATVKTALTSDEAKTFVASAAQGAGYMLIGSWTSNANPYQGTVSSGTYKKNAKALSIFLREKSGVTQVEFNQQR